MENYLFQSPPLLHPLNNLYFQRQQLSVLTAQQQVSDIFINICIHIEVWKPMLID